MLSKKLLLVIGVIALLAMMLPASATVQAATSAACAVNPTHGTPGTTFNFSCTGFPSNTGVSIWVVEPAGVAAAGDWNLRVPTGTRTSSSGSVGFSWHSYGNGERYSQAFGGYKWYVQLANGSVIGSVDVTIDPVAYSVSGANLNVSPQAGSDTFNFTGSGFAPGEIVNIWVALPPNCGSAEEAGEFSALHPGFGFGYQGIYYTEDPRADSAGDIAFPLTVYYHACRGMYTMTARALGSGRGAEAAFEVTGNPVQSNASLEVNPESVDPLAPIVMIKGSGYGSKEGVNCWFTRPDGRVDVGIFTETNTQANGGGEFALVVEAGDATYANPYIGPVSSEEIGQWWVTCRGLPSQSTGIATFWVGEKPGGPSGHESTGPNPGGPGAVLTPSICGRFLCRQAPVIIPPLFPDNP